MWGALQLGQCMCDRQGTGQACNLPSTATSYGKIAYGGIDGLAVAPTGVVVQTKTDPSGEMGLYCWSTTFYGDGLRTACGVKGRDVGRIIVTRLGRLSQDYGRVYRQESLAGLNPFVAVTPGHQTFEWDDYDTAQSDLGLIGAVFASFVSYDELQQVLALADLTASPIFLDLQQGDGAPGQGSQTGTNDFTWTWGSRAVQFGAACLQIEGCGILMESLPSCSDVVPYPNTGVYNRGFCDAINNQNLLYQGNVCSAHGAGCARDGALTTWSTTASNVYTLPQKGLYTLEIFTVKLGDLPFVGTGCGYTVHSVATKFAGVYYQQMICSVPGASTVTLDFSSFWALEVQMYLTQDALLFGYTTRLCAYPYGGVCL